VGDAKQIIVKPISSTDANRLIKSLHYSGKVVQNSQLHLGVFMGDRCGGAMQFGPSLDKRKIVGLVSGTLWNEFLELNRLAFADWLPRNGESRAIAYAMRFIKKTYPWMKWIVSFADGTQCGDGTIYRASGFYLTGLKVNNQIWTAPSGEVTTRMVATDTRRPERGRLLEQVFSRTSLTDGRSKQQQQQQAKSVLIRTSQTKSNNILETGAASMKIFKEAGWKPKEGFQLRYIYFLDPTAKDRLTVPILPFSEIERRGAGMYKGIKRPKQAMASDQEAQRRGSADPDAPTNTGATNAERNKP
jgi:hypothetical protein